MTGVIIPRTDLRYDLAVQRFGVAVRIPLLLTAILALFAGLWGGLLRLAWQWPVINPALPIGHGPLMVSGFFGTLIILERAIALRQSWPYFGAFFSGAGGLLLLLGVKGDVGPGLITLGGFWMVLIFAAILRRQMAHYTLVMAVGASCWFCGSVLWLLGKPVYQVVLWWAAFLVLTIAGERLELSRVIRLSGNAQAAFLGVSAFIVISLVIYTVFPEMGFRLTGLSLVSMAAWLLRYDIARRTIMKTGLTRFMATCLLAGYGWLGAAGFLAMIFGVQSAGMRYDAVLHAVFLGFVFSMVFGHAPMIFPAVLGLPMEYQPGLYLPLILLHSSLALRITADLFAWFTLRQWSSLVNVIAILSYAGLMLFIIMRSQLALRKA